MHLFLLTRGIKHMVDQFVNDMQAQYFPYRAHNVKTDQIEHGLVQGALRPIQLWEYVFPKESLNQVLLSLKLPRDNPQWQAKFLAKTLRKALGAQEIPVIEPDPKAPLKLIRQQDVQIIGIGIREDPEGLTDDVHGNKDVFKQERL